MDGTWHKVAKSADLGERQLCAFEVESVPVLIVRSDGALVAVVDACPHQQALLSSGRLRGRTIMCPLHGARFDLKTGECVGGAYPGLKTLAIREADGEVSVKIP